MNAPPAKTFAGRRGTIDSRKAGLRNEELVLKLLRREGELSQADICRLAGLSSSTSSYIVARLREKGLILERPSTRTQRGARPMMLSIAPEGRYNCGIEINPSFLKIGLFDSRARCIDSIKAPLGDDRLADSVVQALEINLRGLLSKHDVTESRLGGVGVALSGSVTRDGHVKLAAPLGWKSIPLQELLRTQMPAIRFHVYSTRVRLLAETNHPELAGIPDVVLLNVSSGTGANVIVDGQLLHGSGNRTGEIGHVICRPDGEVCGCGNRGCFETMIAGPAIARRIRRDIAGGASTRLTELLERDDAPETVVAKWGHAARESDPYALNVRTEVLRYIGNMATVAINAFDPEVLILAGYVAEALYDELVEEINTQIRDAVYDSAARTLQIVPARTKEDMLMTGAATAVMQNIVVQ